MLFVSTSFFLSTAIFICFVQLTFDNKVGQDTENTILKQNTKIATFEFFDKARFYNLAWSAILHLSAQSLKVVVCKEFILAQLRIRQIISSSICGSLIEHMQIIAYHQKSASSHCTKYQ
jgi:hypothetical protein